MKLRAADDDWKNGSACLVNSGATSRTGCNRIGPISDRPSSIKPRLVLLVVAMILLAAPAFPQTTELRGVVLQDSLIRNGHTLVLNGAGVRTKLVFKLYVGALYLTEVTRSAETIIAANQPMMVYIHVISGLITSDKMIESVRDGFEKSTGGDTSAIQDRIDQLIETFKDDIAEGDVFELIYDPTTGLRVYKNGEMGATVLGLEFKQALFGIWLGKSPVHKKLKNAMLGL